MTVQAKVFFMGLTITSGIILLLYCQVQETRVTNPPVWVGFA